MPVTQRKRSFQLFRKLKFSSCASTAAGDEANLEIDKMILHVLDCLGALQCVMGQYDSSRAKVFWGAVATIAEIGIDQATGHVDRRHPGATHLLRAFPNDLKATDGRGWLPLHWAAVTDNVDVNDVRNIARADPLATVKGYNQPISATPGHLIAAVRHPRMEVVRCLYNFYPRMANAKDNDGDLPLHYAARYSESAEMMLFLLQANPAATKVRGEGNLVPLQHALYNEDPDKKGDIVKLLLDADPSAASIVNADGDTVFHIAINQECNISLLSQLLRAFPEGVRVQNDIGHLALHAACLTKEIPRSVDTVRLLLDAYPEGVRVPCAYGHLPAHIAAESSNVEVLRLILAQYPEAALHRSTEDNHMTPLMKAVSVANEDTVDFLCAQYPESVRLTNSHGLTALHFAAEGDNVRIMRRLVTTHPAIAFTRDAEGRTPLHVFLHTHPSEDLTMASESSPEADCLRFLLAMDPAAVVVKDQHDETPLSLVPAENAFLRRLMMRCQPLAFTPTLRQLNYEQRRWGLFLTEAAINADGIPNIFARLRGTDHHLLKEIFSYL